MKPREEDNKLSEQIQDSREDYRCGRFKELSELIDTHNIDNCDCYCPAQILADMLKDSEDEQQSAEKEINHLITTRATLRDRADNWQACAADLTEQLNDRKEYIDWTYKKMHALERELTSLKDESNHRLHLVEKQRDEITELKNTVEKWESTARCLSAQLSARHYDMVNLLEHFHESEEKLSDSRREVRTLTAQLYSAEDKVAKCSKELAKLLQKNPSPQVVYVPGRNAANCIDTKHLEKSVAKKEGYGRKLEPDAMYFSARADYFSERLSEAREKHIWLLRDVYALEANEESHLDILAQMDATITKYKNHSDTLTEALRKLSGWEGSCIDVGTMYTMLGGNVEQPEE